MTPERVSLVTLGCRDLARTRAFYAALGWREHSQSRESVAFFRIPGGVLALFGLDDLAADQGRAAVSLGTGAMTLAQNFPSRAAVDAAYAAALDAGATGLKPPVSTFWGGYSGYWADPEGHVWEVAHNPFWPLDDDGVPILPEATGE